MVVLPVFTYAGSLIGVNWDKGENQGMGRARSSVGEGLVGLGGPSASAGVGWKDWGSFSL